MSEAMREIEREINALRQRSLQELLARCTAEQQAFFYRLYPSGPSEKQFANAIDQIERTIAKNERLPPETGECETCGGKREVQIGDGYSIDGCPRCEPREETKEAADA